LRFGLATIEPLDDVGANRPRSRLRGLGLLAFAVRLLVGRADAADFDQDMGAFLDVSENGLSQPRAKNRDAMPLDFRDPFVFCVFPGASGSCIFAAVTSGWPTIRPEETSATLPQNCQRRKPIERK